MMRKKRRSSVDISKDAMPTEMSMSKKSRTTGRQAKAVAKEDTSNDSVFGQFIRQSGVILKQGSTANEIAVDQVVFQKRLQQQLKKSPRYPGVLQEFITGLESHIEDPERFRNCLLPCVPCLADGDSSSFQESLLRMLLGIEMLQTLVINTLFEKLPEFMFDGAGEDGLNIPHVIVNQLKWLDRVKDSKELAGKLMQLVSVAPVEIQRDIITSLPEILEDSQHSDIARELNVLLQENTQLTVPILDALSSLNLSSTLLTEVRASVMATLSAVQLEDLPVVVKFILHSISSSDALEVVCELRGKLELELCVLPPVLQASQSRVKNKGLTGSTDTSAPSSSQDSVALVLDSIKSAVRFQKTISEAWLKAIENADAAEGHKAVDLLVLFILHSTNANHSRRGAEKVLKVKVRAGQIQEALLQRTFRGHSQVMRGYFPSILALAQTLLRCPDPCMVAFGGHMYRHSFTAFDSYCQQEVVGSLVTHVCSGVGGEVDVALELLCGLVTEKPAEMALYAVFVKGVLDYMDNLTPQQIRRLFHLLSSMAFRQHHPASHIQDDMHIVIRKQLSSTVLKYKRIGIIGAVRVVGSMGAYRPVGGDPQGGNLPKETYRQVTALLELVRSCSDSSSEAAALYYDELSNLVLTCTLDPLVQAWIGKSVLEDFQEDFVVDVGPEITGSFPFPVCAMYNLDEEDSQVGIAINLLPLLSDDLEHKGAQWSQTVNNKTQRRVSPLCLAPFFRLLRLCEVQQRHGDLEEIDALLGCPLILTDMDVVNKSESLSRPEREFLCGLLFYTINWFREVVNAFCGQKDPEMKMKVVTRLQNITYLQSILEQILAATPGYSPPLANFDGESTEGTALSTSTVAPKKGKKESAGKKKKTPPKNSSADSSQLEELPEAEDTQQDHPEKDKETSKPAVSLVSYRPFFRELDMEVLGVLQCGLLSRSVLDSELHSKVREEVQLGPAELVFLLEDMWRKLEFKLTVSPAKRAPFLKGKTDKSVGFSHLQQTSPVDLASRCVLLLPTLCTHLENCHNHFQTLLSENQGVVDAPGLDVKEHQLLSSAYQLLLQVLHTIFSWSGFSQPEHRGLLKKALGVLAGRLKEEGAELTLEQLIRHSFEYLLNFRSTVPSLGIALGLSQLLITVAGRGGHHATYREQTATLARAFLCQEWVTTSGDREKGPKHNETLQTLLSIYLEHTDDVLKAVEEIAGEGIPELLNAAKDASSRTWPTLNRLTFLVFYKGMMGELEKAVRKIPPGRHSDSTEVKSEKLLTWNMAVRDFHILVNLVKVFDNRSVLNVCLKYGRLFLESFLKLGMPLLDFSFKKHKEDVQSLLKTFQLSTRQLHHLCGHSKIRQDTTLTNHVPALKKSLEQFVYRVKAMLTLNHCQEAFWLGNLKNRDLKGQEILSQQSQGSDDEEEEGSLMPDEHSEDEESDSDGRRNGNRKEEGEDDENTDDSTD
ncbi:Fanconi anemia group D2 protein isoform X2 [Esox lucius]|nr:Fanconi anemia group D2 protein isoform X2 [Esox lucius]XP_010879859.2 Fanconi anemia group D2 protein isoform X2 [Esox lucius]XP_010879860.2 Fanconi anemia group D2 protein isoform X2 [Esox lucius]XP_010879861.2 Fanconi anemia group D2 protein isoform X2 [Esox lucius]